MNTEMAHPDHPSTATAATPDHAPAPVQVTPEASPWSTREKIGRALWMLLGRPLFRLTFHNWYGVRRLILRSFGATIGHCVRVRPTVRIEIPWNVELQDNVVVGDHAILYSLGRITVCERAIISQYAHLCAGTHDFTKASFPLQRPPICIGPDAWVAADAFVGPGVTVGARAILGARASAFKNLEPDMIYAGNPAAPIRPRVVSE